MSDLKNLWAVSIVVSRLREDVFILKHGATLVSATSKDEAFGKAYRIAFKCYPRDDGWKDHSVSVYNCDRGPEFQAE